MLFHNQNNSFSVKWKYECLGCCCANIKLSSIGLKLKTYRKGEGEAPRLVICCTPTIDTVNPPIHNVFAHVFAQWHIQDE